MRRNLILFFALLSIFLTGISFAQTTIFSQNFDGVWTNPPSLSPAWSGTTSPANNVWHMNSYTTGWSSGTGSYTPAGASSTTQSARFHSYDASSSSTGDLISPTLDFSINSDPKRLSFYYINTSGTDVVRIYLSTDNGGTWSASLKTLATASTWTQYSVLLGSTTSTQVQLKFTATSDYGTTDIGVDQVVVDSDPSFVPLTGVKTIGSAGDFTTFTAAINALNAFGVGSGGVTFNVEAGFTSTENCPVIMTIGTLSNPIIFQKSGVGANPLITAGTGTGTGDAIVTITSSYVTFDGIDLQDNAANVTTTTQAEYGFYIKNSSATVGSQYNTIKNSKITLNRANTASKGIYQYYGTTPTNATGNNSYNKYYNITVENAYEGIRLYSYTSTYFDIGNEIGTTGGGATIIGAASNDIGGGTAAVYGIYVYYQKDVKVFNTQVRFAYSTSGAIYVMYCASLQGNSILIYNNVIHDLNATTATSIYGLYLASATSSTVNTYNNSIYNLTSAAAGVTIHGLYVSSGPLHYIYNNFISDLRAPAATGANAVNGINIAGGTSVNAYYNTVYLNATGGATFGSSGLYKAAATTSELRNNIFVNNSTPGATSGNTVAIRWSGVYNPTYYTSTSNNNCFYAGTPAANMLIYFDGTNSDQTIAAYKSRVASRDAGSFTENPPFLNVASTPYNLHLNTEVATQTEGSGSVVSTPIAVSTDFDGDSRNGTTPDVGADEFAGIPQDLTGPGISYTALGNTTSSSTVNFGSVVITDFSGVNGISGTRPRVYYKKSTQLNSLPATNDNTTEGWKWVEANGSASPFDFTIDLSKVFGGVTAGDAIEYFVIAQDNAGTPNVGINSGSFAVNPSSVALTAAAFAIGGTPNQFMISASISGAYTVGTGQYTSLTANTANGLFKAINDGVVTGNITVTIASDLTEDGTVALNQWTEEGAGNYTLTIQPDGTTERVISGTAVAASTPMININGADRVTIDGRFGGSGKYLRFSNTNATASSTGPAIQFTNSSVNGDLKYCYVATNATTSSNGEVTVGATGTNNVTIQYCDILDATVGTPGKAAAGIYSNSVTNTVTVNNNNIYNWTSYGVYLPNAADGCTISSNNLYQTTARTTALYPISVGAGSGHTINSNNIGGSAADRSGAALTTSAAFTGITLAAGTVSYSNIQGNSISNIGSSAGSGCKIISITSGNVNVGTTSGNVIGGGAAAYDTVNFAYDNEAISSTSSGIVNIENNTIGNITYQKATPGGDRTCGIYVAGTGAHQVKNNTIRDLRSNSTGTGTSYLPVGIYLSSTGNGHNIEANQIYNISQTNAGTVAYTVFGIYVSGVASTPAITKIHRNNINNITAVGTGTLTSAPIAAGIYAISGSASYYNNMIALGGSVGLDVRLFGIYDLGTGTNNWYYNSVNISGSHVGDNNSYAFARSGTATVTLKNNIFADTRSGGLGYHVAIANTNAAATGWLATASDYNILYNSSSANIAQWLGTAVANNRTLAGWQALQGDPTPGSGGDANTLSGNPGFTSSTDLHISVSTILASNNGTPLAGVVDNDYDNTARSETTPDRGADEYIYVVPSVLDPTGVTASVTSSSSNRIAYTVNGNSNNVVIVWNETGTFEVPSGVPPVPGAAFAGGTLLSNNTVSPQDHSGLTMSTTYYYKLFSYDGSNYSTGITANATPVVSAPTDVTATPVSTVQIDLGWTKNTHNDSIMVLTKSTNSFGTPVNGTVYTVNDTVTGGGTVIYNGSASAYNHTALTMGTTYYYKVFSVETTTNIYSTGVAVNATTVCGAYATPYVQNLDATTFPPNCWTITNAGSGNNWSRSTSSYSGAAAMAYQYNSAAAANAWAFTPELTLTSGITYRISFYQKVASATWPEKMKVTVGSAATPVAQTTTLWDNAGGTDLTNTTYLYRYIDYNCSTTGSYYFAFNCYSDADMYNLYVDQVEVKEVPLVDLSLNSFVQFDGTKSIHASDKFKDYSVSIAKPIQGQETNFFAELPKNGVVVQSDNTNNTVILKESEELSVSKSLNNITLKSTVENLGQNAATYDLGWSVGGVAQTTYVGPSVAAASSDVASITFAPTARGTFYTPGTITVTGDENSSNNSSSMLLRVYPNTFTRGTHDNGTNTVSTYVGWNSLTTPMKAGVRFTAASDIKLAGVDFIYRTEDALSGTVSIQVCAAGSTTLAPGAVLYTQEYTANSNYLSTNGNYFTFAFAADAPTIASGSDYWITIKAPTGVLYPGGAQQYTSGRSFYAGNVDTTAWTALNLSAVDYSWIMRSINVAQPTLTVKALFEGLNFGHPRGSEGKMIADTVVVELHNATTPFALVESVSAVFDTMGNAVAKFSLPEDGANYYLALNHRNSVETWSAASQTFTNSALTYDFSTAANKAYGDNLKPVGSFFTIYTGDSNKDDFVDFTDLTLIDNDSYNFVEGYVITDLNGDLFVDFTDLTLCDNNSYNFIGSITPLTGKKVINTKPVRYYGKDSKKIVNE
ncbi:MAG: hypothetical protein HYV28_03090 [Ignavibacteriales bacterium]|nr:hypothetical protein [Ignavibacteriales bacterium]